MGREIKMVSADFDWPLNKVWPGYLMDVEGEDCATCGGRGDTPHGQYLEHVAGIIALAGSYPEGHGFMQSPYRGRLAAPGVKWAELSGALAGRGPRRPFGHDACDKYAIAKALVEAAGLPDDWDHCPDCNGNGCSDEQQARYDAWEKTEPPKGDHYQLWETTSEGSPMSPPMPTPEALADWLFENKASTFGDSTTTRDGWLRFIKGPGWAPSMVAVGGHLSSGVDAAGGDA